MCVTLHVLLHPLCTCDVIFQLTHWGSADAGPVMGRPLSVIGRVGDGCHVHGVGCKGVGIKVLSGISLLPVN